MEFKNKELYHSIGIYGIRNLISNKIYIGQTGESFIRRFWHHRWKLRNNEHDNSYLQNAWNKYGENAFEFIVVECVQDISLLDNLEIKYIQHYKELKLSYNLSDGGQGKRGFSMNENAKRIVGEKNRKHMLGKKLSDETKAKMSKSRKGKVIHKKTDVLNEDLVSIIKADLISGCSLSDTATNNHVSYKAVNALVSNNTWKHVYVEGWDNYLLTRKKTYRLKPEERKEIYNLYSCGKFTKKELAQKYNKSIASINVIIRKYAI